jgi:mono/diheme cytochrome c family protein
MARSLALLLVVFVAFACLIANAQPVVKKVPVTPTSPASGQVMFKTYCAACHGVDGKGDGPAGPALKKQPANLTDLTERNGGKFPDLKVFNTIKGDSDMPAHGSRDMPVWGNLFPSISRGNPAEVQMRIANLTDYIKSLQVGAGTK